MVSIGLLLGVLMICIQSVFQGTKANPTSASAGRVGFYMPCFLRPTTTVTIEDAYTGQVQSSNVPIEGWALLEVSYPTWDTPSPICLKLDMG